ncbi:MAG TPA: ATP phosphoribosyltransferase [Coriobacteriia bacterium]
MTAGRLRMAIPKGSLFEGSLRVLRAADVEIGALADPGRLLIVDTDEIRFIIGKPTDIPAYVAYGAADVAIAGADVLAEAALDVAELADLRFGACRFVVAEREGSSAEIADSYRRLGVVRVATKYPRITEAYFADRGVQVEIVKLHGNIELAPLIGLADQVVDITATGTTLRDNHLRIVDEVMASSARFVANPVAVRIDSQRVMDLAGRLARAAGEVE